MNLLDPRLVISCLMNTEKFNNADEVSITCIIPFSSFMAAVAALIPGWILLAPIPAADILVEGLDEEAGTGSEDNKGDGADDGTFEFDDKGEGGNEGIELLAAAVLIVDEAIWAKACCAGFAGGMK